MFDTTMPIRTSDFAKRLGVKAAWLREEALAGRVPALRAGDDFLFHPIEAGRVLLERASRGEVGAPPALSSARQPLAAAS